MVNPSLHHFLPGSSWPIQERPKRGSDVSQLTPSCRNARMNSSTSYIYIYIHIIQYTLLKTHCWSVFVCFLVSLNPICICSFHKKSTATAPKAKLRVTNPQPSRQPTSHGHHRAGIKKKHNQDSRWINQIGFGASLQISEPWSNQSLKRLKSCCPLRSPIHKHLHWLHWKSLHLSHFVAGQAQHWKRPVTKTTTVVSLLFVLRIYGWYPLNRFKDYWPMDEIGWIQINLWNESTISIPSSTYVVYSSP